MMRNTLAFLAALSAVSACKTPAKSNAPALVEAEEKVVKMVLPDGVEGLDINHDGTPDVFKHYKEVDGERRIIKRETDLNADGKVDVTLDFDITGARIKEVIDLDFDAKVDVTRYYENDQVIREEFDMNFDGAVDLVKFYEAGVIIRKEQDAKLDGSIDYWEYFDEKGALERIGVDHDGDGEIDAWHLPTQGVIADPEVVGAGGADGKDAVDRALDRQKVEDQEALERSENAAAEVEASKDGDEKGE